MNKKFQRRVWIFHDAIKVSGGLAPEASYAEWAPSREYISLEEHKVIVEKLLETLQFYATCGHASEGLDWDVENGSVKIRGKIARQAIAEYENMVKKCTT